MGEALEAKLKNKKNMLPLYLLFNREEAELRMNDDAAIEALQPPSNLEHLGIYQYRGPFFLIG